MNRERLVELSVSRLRLVELDAEVRSGIDALRDTRRGAPPRGAGLPRGDSAWWSWTAKERPSRVGDLREWRCPTGCDPASTRFAIPDGVHLEGRGVAAGRLRLVELDDPARLFRRRGATPPGGVGWRRRKRAMRRGA